MNDHIEVVEQDPRSFALPSRIAGKQPFVALEGLAHLSCDCLRLPRVATAADHEVVGEAARPPQVETEDLLCDLALSNPDDLQRELERLQDVRVLRRVCICP